MEYFTYFPYYNEQKSKIDKMTSSNIIKKMLTISNNACHKMLTFSPGELQVGSCTFWHVLILQPLQEMFIIQLLQTIAMS